jgi:predicted kinase
MTLSTFTADSTSEAFAACAELERARTVRLTRDGLTKPLAIFVQGLPGAGKSTTIDRLLPGFDVLCADAIKATHKDYDPKNPQALHAWSRALQLEQWGEALEAGDSHILDGTATNGEKLRARMGRARAAGFSVVLFHVRCCLNTSLDRNRRRARTLPSEVIVTKAKEIMGAFDESWRTADLTIVISSEQWELEGAALRGEPTQAAIDHLFLTSL